MHLLDSLVLRGKDGEQACEGRVEEVGTAVGDFVEGHRVGFGGQGAVEEVIALVQLLDIFRVVVGDVVEDV
jgi:hypothetical protein